MIVAFYTKERVIFKTSVPTNGNYVLKTFVTSVRGKRWVQKIYQPHKFDNFLKTFFPRKWLVYREILKKTFSGFYFLFSTVFCHFPVLVQILSFKKRLLLFIGHLFNKTNPKHCLKKNVQERLWKSGFITSPTENSNSRSSWRYRSLPQEPAGVKVVGGVLSWWVSISGEEWCWGSTWGGRYPLKDVRPWLDPCTAGEGAPAKTKPAVERKG